MKTWINKAIEITMGKFGRNESEYTDYEKERLVRVEAKTDDIKKDLKYLYVRFSDHMKDDAKYFGEVREQIMKDSILIHQVAEQVKTLTTTVQEQTTETRKLLRFYNRVMGGIATLTVIAGVAWAIVQFLLPLLVI
jgi:hypothetical protein